jgi:hypothetical protein
MKNKHAIALGRKGGKAGTGKAKARTSEQAWKAALTRWNGLKILGKTKRGGIILKAPPLGSFLKGQVCGMVDKK